MERRVLHNVGAERSAPDRVMVRCSCGWSTSQTRRQNALARAAKLRAAVAEHFRAVNPKEEGAR